ncbi:hypothetical protein [Rhizobium leguminosarum]|uniref:hypothetical protein n=1 Tax=Rhizobium leguminosarum TaxID=384 RepID=UPI003D0193DD
MAILSRRSALNLCDIIKTPIRRLKTKAQYQSLGDPRNNARAHADRLAQALKIDMIQWFEPTTENYFGRISKTEIEQALTEAKGADFAAGVSGLKKADAAAYAERQIAGTGWLPALLKIALIADPERVGRCRSSGPR